MNAHLLGYDIGSSSVKASLVDAETGQPLSSAAEPANEMEIISRHPGWAEQDPATWWENLKVATRRVMKESNVKPSSVIAIGVSYQMHGLVVVDEHRQVVRPSIIWCDSRAVETGERALRSMGSEYCEAHLLNSPGNFTASKLKWVKENEPEAFARVNKMMLPGDYIAMRLTGEISTTASGLSEGILWDFKQQIPAAQLLEALGIDPSVVAPLVSTFANQGTLTATVASELGLAPGTPLCYRAGDQPNNAFALNALQPGEVAATAGTSGVIYAVTDQRVTDKRSRVNTFLHVNDNPDQPRLGVLLCVNGTGIMNRWLRKMLGPAAMTYDEMNSLAARAPVGAEQLVVLPFGNGAERMLDNREVGASVHGLNLVRHETSHLCRAVQEGIVFALGYGFEALKDLGVRPQVIRAGRANMFQSEVFCKTFARVTGTELQLFETDGAQGAARGAGVGVGHYRDMTEAFRNLRCVKSYLADTPETSETLAAFQRWKSTLDRQLH